MNKVRYNVSILHKQIYDGCREVETEEFIGSTYAVSERQAINNIKYRNKISNSNMECYGVGYIRTSQLVARRAY